MEVKQVVVVPSYLQEPVQLKPSEIYESLQHTSYCVRQSGDAPSTDGQRQITPIAIPRVYRWRYDRLQGLRHSKEASPNPFHMLGQVLDGSYVPHTDDPDLKSGSTVQVWGRATCFITLNHTT